MGAWERKGLWIQRRYFFLRKHFIRQTFQKPFLSVFEKNYEKLTSFHPAQEDFVQDVVCQSIFFESLLKNKKTFYI